MLGWDLKMRSRSAGMLLEMIWPVFTGVSAWQDDGVQMFWKASVEEISSMIQVGMSGYKAHGGGVGGLQRRGCGGQSNGLQSMETGSLMKEAGKDPGGSEFRCVAATVRFCMNK